MSGWSRTDAGSNPPYLSRRGNGRVPRGAMLAAAGLAFLTVVGLRTVDGDLAEAGLVLLIVPVA